MNKLTFFICFLIFSFSLLGQERHISKFFDEPIFREQFEYYRYPDHDKLVFDFINKIEKDIDLNDPTSIDDAKDNVFPLNIPFYQDSIFIYEVGYGIAPVEFYLKEGNFYNRILKLEGAPTFLKEINIDSNYNCEIILYSPHYVFPIESESIIRFNFSWPQVYKNTISSSCVEEPTNYYENPIKALVENNIKLFENPRIHESKCTLNEYDKIKEENSFAIFHKNSLVKILAEDLTNKKEKWVFIEIEARNKINEINFYYDTVDYKYNFIDFFIGWTKAEYLRILE